MAINKEQLTVEVVLDSSGAIKGIKDLKGQFVEFDKIVANSSRQTDKVESSTSRFQGTMSGVVSTLSKAALPMLAVQSAVGAINSVFGTLSSTLGSFVNDYAAAEKAQILLTQAIENAGGRIQNQATAWGDYLDALQEVKAIDADVLRGLVAQAVQMGFSETQIKSLVEATIGLSKVTGDSLDGSFQRLIGTTRGMARGLSALVPELQNLTPEALQNGDAFELVAKKYKSAADGAGSYSRSVKVAGLAAGELSEDIGKLIIETLNIKGAMDVATSAINSVRNAIANVDFDALRKSFKEFSLVAGPVVLVIGAVTAGLTGLASAAWAVVAPILLVTAKVALIAVAVAGTIAAIEMIVRSFGLFDEVLAVVANSIAYLIIKPFGLATLAVREFFGLFGTDNAFYKAADKAFKDVEKSVSSITSSISNNSKKIAQDINFGFSGEVVKQGINFIKGFGSETDRTSAKLKQLGEVGSRVKIVDEKALEKAKTLADDLKKMTNDLTVEAQKRGATELEQAQIVYQENLKSIDAKKQELATLGQLTSANLVIIQQAKDAAKANYDNLLTQIQNKDTIEAIKKAEKDVSELRQKSTDTLDKINQSNLGTYDLIQSQYEVEVNKLDKMQEMLELRGNLTIAEQEALDIARETAKVVKEAAETKATQENVKGLITAAGSGAEAVVSTAINQIGAAFGPEGQIAAGLVNLLRQGGDKMKELGAGLVDIVTNLPKNISEGAVALITSIVDGLTKFLNDPKAVSSFITNMTTLMPKVMAALIKATPQLAIALSRPSFWIEVAKAWVKALVDSVGEIRIALVDALKEAGKEISAAFNKAIDDVGKFFSEIGPKIWESIKGAFENPGEFFSNLASKLWTAIKDGASAIFDTIKDLGTKIWDGLSDKLQSLKDSLFESGKEIWNGLKSVFGEISKAFSGLGEGIWQALKDSIKRAGGAIVKFLGLADGGIVPGVARLQGDSSRNDFIPAMLSPGEAVIPRSLMANPDISKLVGSILSNRTMSPMAFDKSMPRLSLANGGIVPAIAGRGGQTFGDTNVNVVLQIETNQQLDESFIRQRLMPALKSELKASSLRGEFILSAKGVRG